MINFKTLILIEYQHELNDVLKRLEEYKLQTSDILFVTPSPNLRMKLIELKLHSPSTTELVEVEKHLEGNVSLNSIMEEMVQSFRKIVSSDHMGFHETYRVSLQYRLQYVFSHWIFITQLYLGAIRKYPSINKVMTVSSELMTTSDLLTVEESYLVQLGAKVAQLYKLQFEVIRTQCLSQVKSISLGSQFLTQTINAICRPILHKVLDSLQGKWLVLTSVVNKMDVLVKECQSKDPTLKLCYLRHFSIQSRPSGLYETLKFWVQQLISVAGFLIGKKLTLPGRNTSFDLIVDFQCLTGNLKIKDQKQDPQFQHFLHEFSACEKLIYQGITFNDLIATKLRYGVLPVMRDLRKKIVALQLFHKLLKHKFYLTPHTHDLAYALGEMCSLRGEKNALLISHGSHPPPARSSLAKEYKRHGEVLIDGLYPLVALQTPLAQKYIEYFHTPSKGIITGPLTWGLPIIPDSTIRHRLGLAERKKLIIHAGTQKARSSHYFMRYETGDEYIEGIKDLIESVRDNDDVILLIKFRDGETLSMQTLQALLPKAPNVFYNKNDSFLKLLHEASLVVSFSSTTLEEALQYAVPVLQYGGRGRLPFIDSKDYADDCKFERSPVYFTSKSTTLNELIQKILIEFESKKLNQEELKNYVYSQEERKSISALIDATFR